MQIVYAFVYILRRAVQNVAKLLQTLNVSYICIFIKACKSIYPLELKKLFVCKNVI